MIIIILPFTNDNRTYFFRVLLFYHPVNRGAHLVVASSPKGSFFVLDLIFLSKNRWYKTPASKCAISCASNEGKANGKLRWVKLRKEVKDISIININSIIAGSVERARAWVKEGDKLEDIYRSLAPAILTANQKLSIPSVSPTRELENLLRMESGWDPAKGTSGFAAKWGPC